MDGKELTLIDLGSRLDHAEQLPLGGPSPTTQHIRLNGKFFRCGTSKWFVKGLTYGPFAPGAEGIFLPSPQQVRSDLGQIRTLGANAIRLYHVPPQWLIHAAAEVGLRVFIDVPWEKHRCFLEDQATQRDAIERVRSAARLGVNPAVFAISVANEVPKDIVRYYGEDRIEQFLRELLDAARQEAPDCLLTYTNYPSTEFLSPAPVDFQCFNVYLEDPHKLGAYLDRLQHIAGAAPLILGEHGFDSMRNGLAAQADQIREQVRRVFAHGLAGSFVFSFTDDWFAGGVQVEDWAFGITDRQRSEKPAATALRKAWTQVPFCGLEQLPSVSVVVCSYNGAATLDECLRSLSQVRYPDLEVILVDDGSTDDTRQIAGRYPDVKYIYQENRGLSAARNVGARAARGEIVAYTDSDCVVDEDWLTYLVHEMQRQQVDGIGGPNIPPPEDCWVARCVALSPGGPSHVMMDDLQAEHVPGCNMAFRRDRLLAIGGFDEQFRVAGDDVDICWRFLDQGWRLGYTASAVVWHHRRTSVRAYLRQQIGYGRSEAMLYFKHPGRFNEMGSSLWSGVIYGDNSDALPFSPPVIYHGRFGLELFPAIYRQTRFSVWAYFTLLEWHALAGGALALGLLYPPLIILSVMLWTLTLVSVLRSGRLAALPAGAPRWSRALVCLLHLVQPVVRGWQRYAGRIRSRRRAPQARTVESAETQSKSISPLSFDLYWQSDRGHGREVLLEKLVQTAQERGWRGDFHCDWAPWDLLLVGDNWHAIELRTATEELGEGNRFTRVRARLRVTGVATASAVTMTLWSGLAIWQDVHWAQWIAIIGCTFLAARLLRSRHTCRRAVAGLLASAARRAGLTPVRVPTALKADPVDAAPDSADLHAAELRA